MFEGLRKKFSNFIGNLAKKETEEAEEEEKQEEAKAEAQPEAKKEEEAQEQPGQSSEAPKEEERKQPEQKAEEPRQEEKKEPEKPSQAKQQYSSPSHGIKTAIGDRGIKYTSGQPVAQKPKPRESDEYKEMLDKFQKENMQPEAKAEEKVAFREPVKQPAQPQPKITFTTKLKSVIFRQVKISEKDADPFIEGLKMDLLQSDVNYDVTEKITASIRNGLVGKAVDSKNISGEITETIRGSIMQVLSSSPEIDIVRMANQKRDANQLPFKIMFIGPNGAGKTTTMAKIASMLLANNVTCVLSASDTFRAAAIEQTAIHAGRLGINVIKGNYGADPASVAFDAIAHAKAHGIMAVLIDSAGRQETNKSLIEELKKMTRVTAPDLKIFVGEAISGNALLDQVKAINEAVKIDGIILTKLDVDAKGGNTLSILSDTTIPILFFGTGEKYTDIMRYDPKFIVDNILPSGDAN